MGEMYIRYDISCVRVWQRPKSFIHSRDEILPESRSRKRETEILRRKTEIERKQNKPKER